MRYKARTGRFPALVLFLMLFSIMAPSASEVISGKEAELGVLYASYAQQAYNEGDSANAGRLADAALVFDPGNCDALVISGFLEADRGNLESALSYFERALVRSSSADTLTVENSVLRYRMADTAFRLGYPERAYIYLSPLKRESDLPVSIGALLTRILTSLGRESEARELAGELVSRDPLSPEAATLFMELDTSWLPPYLIRPDDPESAVERLTDYNKNVVRLVYQRMINRNLQIQIGSLYRRLFGEDLFWYLTEGIRSLADSSDEELASMINRALEADPPGSREEIAYFHSLLKQERHKTVFDRWFSGFSGILASDTDGDGYIDTREEYEKGILVHYQFDRNQNGIYDYVVHFEKGLPKSVLKDVNVYRYTYSDYPYLDSFVVADSERESSYKLYPYDFIHRITYSPRLESTLHKTNPGIELSMPPENRIATRALSVSTVLPDYGEDILVRRSFSGGMEFRISSAREGTIRERRDLEGGFTIRERDPGGDGSYEITETYLDGRLIEMAYDEDGDGNPEYVESYGEKTVYLWDLNSNGIFDIREYMDEAGNRIKEVSTKMDGVFDYQMSTPVVEQVR